MGCVGRAERQDVEDHAPRRSRASSSCGSPPPASSPSRLREAAARPSPIRCAGRAYRRRRGSAPRRGRRGRSSSGRRARPRREASCRSSRARRLGSGRRYPCRGSGSRSRGSAVMPRGGVALRARRRGNDSVLGHAVGGLRARDPAALGADRVGRQPESDRGHARERFRRSAIRDQMGARIGEVPEPLERLALEDVQKLDRLGVALQRRRGEQRRGPPLGGPAAEPAEEDEREDGGRAGAGARHRSGAEVPPPGRLRRCGASGTARSISRPEPSEAARRSPNWKRRGCVIRQSGVPKF